MFRNDFRTAIYCIETGLKYYPKEPGIKLFELELYILSGNKSMANQLLNEFDELIRNPAIKLADKMEWNEWYESIKSELK